MTKLPAEIVVTKHADSWSLCIDGEDFPWYIDADGVSTQVGNDCPSITITILAESVRIDHSLDRAEKHIAA